MRNRIFLILVLCVSTPTAVFSSTPADRSPVAIPGSAALSAGGPQASKPGTKAIDGAPPSWTEQRVIAQDGALQAHFGVSVAIDGNVAAIGAELASVDGIAERGAVYVFEKSNGHWLQTAKLASNTPDPYQFFGHALAIEGNTLLVSAYATATNGIPSSGAVHVFTASSDGGWSHAGIIAPHDLEATGFFGTALALQGDTALIGAGASSPNDIFYGGAAYVFRRNSDGVWMQQQKLTASDASDWARFGYSVALDGGQAVIGAMTANVNGMVNHGAVYVFSQDSDGFWNQTQKLTASDGAASQAFGSGVGIQGDTMVIGSQWATVNGVWNHGAAYVFRRSSDGDWNQVQKLVGTETLFNDHFGNAISLKGNSLLVGAYYANIPPNASLQGAAYLFKADSDGVWSEVDRYIASDGQACDQLGVSVALGEDVALVGSHYATPFTTFEEGAAYFYGDVAPTDILHIGNFEEIPGNPCAP